MSREILRARMEAYEAKLKGQTCNEDQSVDVKDTLSSPADGPDTGIAHLLISAINDEWATISSYNDIIVTVEAEGRSDIADILRDIVNEENIHIGQLQKALETISANVASIDKGEIEAESQLK